jgi:hypothetical protein
MTVGFAIPNEEKGGKCRTWNTYFTKASMYSYIPKLGKESSLDFANQ